MDTVNTKAWYLSRGVIGSAVAIAAGAAAVFHYQIASLQASLVEEILGSAPSSAARSRCGAASRPATRSADLGLGSRSSPAS
jgi:hypothetical protein